MTVRKLVWSEGLFITQHHFQQLDRYHELLLDQRLRALSAYSWGVSAVEIDERALAANQLQLKAMSGVFPDGTSIVCSTEAGNAPPPRSLEGVFPAHLKALPVFIGLPHARDGVPTLESEGEGNPFARYLRQQLSVTDESTGHGDHQISWARPNVRLLLGTESREAFDVIQIAELIRGGTGEVQLRDTFVPPVFGVGASPFIMNRLRALLTAMTGRQRALAGSRRERTEAAVEFEASDSAKFWLLDTLNESIPEVSHIVEHGQATPEHTYLVLARLAGRLMTFAVQGDPTELPKFNYLDLGDTFERLFARILILIEVAIAERFVEIPLQRAENGILWGQVQETQLFRYDFFLAARGVPEQQIREGLPKFSKIASWQQMSAILNSAINGARLELEYRPPGALPLRAGVVVFRVHKTPEFWKDIQSSGTIAIFHPPAPATLQISLYAVDPKNL